VTRLREREIAWGSTEFIVIRPRPTLPKEFGYLLARDESFRAYAIQSMTGTSGRQRVPTDSLRTFAMVRPPTQLFIEFASLVRVPFKSIAANSEECDTLAATRDLLLPKLMSGEIRVKDAEKIAVTVL
jgi:type I restriction enzyme S subunit